MACSGTEKVGISMVRDMLSVKALWWRMMDGRDMMLF